MLPWCYFRLPLTDSRTRLSSRQIRYRPRPALADGWCCAATDRPRSLYSPDGTSIDEAAANDHVPDRLGGAPCPNASPPAPSPASFASMSCPHCSGWALPLRPGSASMSWPKTGQRRIGPRGRRRRTSQDMTNPAPRPRRRQTKPGAKRLRDSLQRHPRRRLRPIQTTQRRQPIQNLRPPVRRAKKPIRCPLSRPATTTNRPPSRLPLTEQATPRNTSAQTREAQLRHRKRSTPRNWRARNTWRGRS